MSIMQFSSIEDVNDKVMKFKINLKFSYPIKIN